MGRRRDRVRRGLVAVLAMSLMLLPSGPVVAASGPTVSGAGVGAGTVTLEEALRQAYENNPTLNAQRAALRAIDENVPRALSGFRPTITALGDYGTVTRRSRTTGGITTSNSSNPGGASLVLDQNLFNGFRDRKSVV